MTLRLRVVSDQRRSLADRSTAVFSVEGGTIGRSADNDIVLPDKSVSRRHAAITRSSDGGFYLRDLQSQNGTYVDDHRVVEYLLSDGNKIEFGDLRFTFHG